TIENYPDGDSETLLAKNHPQKPEMGTRSITFSKVIYIERDDFLEDAPKKFFRLSVGREVRLRYAYYITCTDFVKDDNGEVIELICRYDPETKGGSSPDGRKVKGTIHWVSAEHAIDADVNLYDRLFTHPNPAACDDFTEHLNAASLTKLTNCKLEPTLATENDNIHYQFERTGYFIKDNKTDKLTFNRTVTLRDAWAKIDKQNV
ncbi:MAG: glutamine--tRNA ligase, partial [Gammaproteobacteria bacterium]